MRLEIKDATALVGRRLGEFIVREPMSSGGFGLVFRAEQPALAREAVIKVLHARLRGSETVIQRFLREARLASRLDHPFAAHIYAFGVESDGLMWIAMELVRGTPLDKLLEAKGPISLERFVPLLERICQVVQTAHEQGIVHRDLKPANVMVLVRAGQLLPKLLDLGIAKLDGVDAPGESRPTLTPPTGTEAVTVSLADTMAPEANAGEANTAGAGPHDSTGSSSGAGRLTEHGAVIGSPLYMAPEQWLDAATTGPRTDLYALGVLSYESLTGNPPFIGATRMEIAQAHARKAPPPLGEGFPVALDAVLAKVLAKNADDRYGSALELATAFRAASGIAEEAEGLPRLDDALRGEVLTRAPQPIAQAVSTLHAARNAHQARAALWQLVHVIARFAGMIALAAHSHVGGARARESGIVESLRRLRNRSLPDREWVALAKELVAPFVDLRAAYPMPELIDLVEDPASPLVALTTLADEDTRTSDPQVRELLAQAMPVLTRLLEGIRFLGEYQLVVPLETGVTRWVGIGTSARIRVPTSGQALRMREPAFLDPGGTPVISLAPFMQLHAPAPGVPEQLFFLEGKGRRGARMRALPDAFEIEDEGLWEVVGGLVQDPSVSGNISEEEVCPYPGLTAFSTTDAGRFFGRERETEAFANRLRAQAFLAVVGPSGAGKSSFLQAGVIPALPDDWRVITMRPGTSPLVNLCARLGGIVDPSVLLGELKVDPSSLGTRLRARESSGMTMLVVDQFEELFTLCEDPEERERFAEALVRAARSADESVRIVLTLRDDFLLHAEGLTALRSRLAPALHLLTTPGPVELRRILTEPLKQAGYELDDPKLVDDMIEALADTRSPLALLSFTCSKLWDLRDRRFRQIARKAYTSLGGVGGALAQHAEQTLAAMRPEEQRLVREVFRHAVTADGTRAVLARTELVQLLGKDVAAKTVIEKLISARLLATADSATGGEQIEITHEALIHAWPRLVTWRREDAEGARLRDQLRAAAKQWDERGRPTGLLWRGDALAEYRLWRERYPGILSTVDEEFASASLSDTARSTKRRRILIASAFAILAVGVVILVLQNTRVAHERLVATTAAATLEKNLVTQYEDQARRYIVDDEPLLGLAYLYEAHKHQASGKALDLLAALGASAVTNKQYELRSEEQTLVLDAAFTRDGSQIAVTDSHQVRFVDAATGATVRSLTADQYPLAIAMTPASSVVVAIMNDNRMAIWNGSDAVKYLDPNTDIVAYRLSADGSTLFISNRSDQVIAWNLAAGTSRIVFPSETPALPTMREVLLLSPDGTRLAFGDSQGVTHVWDAHTYELLAQNADHQGTILELAFTPDGRELIAASADATASVIDATTGKRRLVVRHEQQINAVAIDSSGKRFATGSNDRTATIWDLATGEEIRTVTGHEGGINVVEFAPGGDQIATGGDDRVAILWDVETGRLQARFAAHKSALQKLRFNATGTRMVTVGQDTFATVWAPRTNVVMRHLHGHQAPVFAVDVSPDSRRVVSGGGDGISKVWDRASATLLYEIEGSQGVRTARFSPDGTMLAIAGIDGTVRIYDSEAGRLIRELVWHTRKVTTLAWFPDNRRIATGSEDTDACVLAIDRDTPYWCGSHDAFVRSVAVSPDGRSVLSGSWEPSVVLRRADSGWPYGYWNGASTADLDSRGTSILGTDKASAWTQDLQGNVLVELLDTADLLSIRWSPHGDFILTASVDGTARIWESKRGGLIAKLSTGDPAPMWSVVMSPDERAVVAGDQYGYVTIWELPPPVTDLEELDRCHVRFEVKDTGLVEKQDDQQTIAACQAKRIVTGL